MIAKDKKTKLIVGSWNNFLYLFIVFIIPAILLAIWIKPGYLIARAEEGIPLYNSELTFNLLKYPFNDVVLGLANPFHLPRITFFGVASIFSKLGIDGWIIQAVVFYVLLAIPLFIIPRIIKILFPTSRFEIGIFSALFYLFNLYTLSQVWGRFLYPIIFSWSYLPLFLFLWIRYLTDGKYSDLLLFMLSSILLSTAFGLTASIFTILIPPGIYSVLLLFKSNKKLKALIFKRGILIFIVWILVNSWWIYPLKSLNDTTYSTILNAETSKNSLTDVSKYFDSGEIVLLRQKYLFGTQSPWHDYFQKSAVLMMSKIIVYIVIIGVFVSRHQRYWLFPALLLFTGWFMSKGSNPPFGIELYDFLYTYIPVTQVLRNPYEKVGLVFVFPYAIFFSFGLAYLIDIFKINKILIVSLSAFIFFVYVPFPIWSRSYFAQSRVSVPPYYNDANEFLSKSEGRILHLPFLFGSGLSYTWGYNGEEPSDYLFENTSVSRILSISSLDDFYYLLGRNIQNRNVYKLLSVANIKSLIVHNDTIKSTYYQDDYYSTTDFVKKLDSVLFVKSFGNLDLYTIDDSVSLGRLYVSENLILVDSLDEFFIKILNSNFNIYNDAMLVVSQNTNSDYNKMAIMQFDKPIISFSKINPMHYKAHVTKADKPFVLTLANNFDNHWEAIVDESTVENHFEINGFANGWIINKSGEYDIDIVFRL